MIKTALKQFAYQTFRPHSKEEYKELFRRGGEGPNTVYPWFWARFLLFGFLAFSLMGLGYDLNGWAKTAVVLFGGILADLTFVILLYELYPKKDIPLYIPVLTLFLGGAASLLISNIIYGAAQLRAPFVQQLWTAFVEETAKGAIIIVLLAFFKKRSPYFCLLIGAAVGGGYSAFENMGYMEFGVLSHSMLTGLVRGLGTPFSHAAWAALFGLSLCPQKCHRTVWPYAAYAFGFTMHFFVNFPLMDMFAGWKGYPISALTGVITFAAFVYVTVKVRKNYAAYSDGKRPVFEAYPRVNLEGHKHISALRPQFKANLAAACAIFCFAASLLGPTCVYGGYRTTRIVQFGDFASAAALAQQGYELTPDFNRPFAVYGDLTQNYSYTVVEGELVSAVQREQYGDYSYLFGYDLVTAVYPEGEEGEPAEVRLWELTAVWLERDNGYRYAQIFYDLSAEPDAYGRYPLMGLFIMNPSVIYVTQSESGYNVAVSQRVEIRLVESVVYSAVFFAASAASLAAYITIKIKSRREIDVGP